VALGIPMATRPRVSRGVVHSGGDGVEVEDARVAKYPARRRGLDRRIIISTTPLVAGSRARSQDYHQRHVVSRGFERVLWHMLKRMSEMMSVLILIIMGCSLSDASENFSW
jgi:hypothetical protein